MHPHLKILPRTRTLKVPQLLERILSKKGKRNFFMKKKKVSKVQGVEKILPGPFIFIVFSVVFNGDESWTRDKLAVSDDTVRVYSTMHTQ